MTPSLVNRSRAFEKEFSRPGFTLEDMRRNWHLLGLREAINKPEDRP